ncbi:MAG: right-handed parallel beta-helix repeat-containing protein [Candidatus Hermodarchaeia archaeon]
MKLKAVSGIVLSLLLLGMLILTVNIQPVKASGTITIKADGSIEGTTDIMTVDNVTYTFTGNINDSIVIERDNIVVDGAGYTVQGNGSGTGIDLSYRNNITLKNVEVTKFNYGIYLDSSSNNTLAGNTVSSNNWYGIVLYSSSNNNTIIGNIASNTGDGISLESSSNNTVIGNTVSSNGLHGIYLDSSSNNTVIGNTASNNNHCGIWLSDSSSNTVTGNNASNNYDGIYLGFSSNNNTITGNTASNNTYGIYLSHSSNNTVIGNTVSSNGFDGIDLSSSSNNTVIGNNASSNNDDGIDLSDFSNNNTVTGNTASFNLHGIRLWSSNNTAITGNTVSSNNETGILLSYSSNNFLFHNNLISNTLQANITTGYVNIWDDGYPSGGNYWSDYNGTDSYSGLYQNETGSDGIGDSSHILDADNQDNYPLMGMFSDFKATSEHHVQTICNSSISDFQYNGTAIGFNVTGETDTTGFCRICIPRALMNETYQVFANGTEVQCNLLPCSNTTHSYLYFTYNLSTQEVIIIPEFLSFLILPLFMIATLLAVIVYRRKHTM